MAKMDRSAAKRALQVLALAGLFLVSFVLFLFLTFPYEVLKESLAAEVSQSSGYIIRIGGMSSGFPLGLKAENVKIESANGNFALNLKRLRVDVHPLSLLLGKLAATADASAGAGTLEIGVDFGVFDLMAGNTLPKHFFLTATSFPLDETVAFALGLAANSPTANPMVAPLLSAIGFSGQLNGTADFKLDIKNPTQSTGQAEIALAKAVLKLSHPSLGLPDQTFKKALIKAKVDSGNVVLDDNSGFNSDELEISTKGKITLKPQPSASVLDLKILLKLNKGLKDKFGFVIGAVTGSATADGQLTIQIRGPMESAAVTTF